MVKEKTLWNLKVLWEIKMSWYCWFCKRNHKIGSGKSKIGDDHFYKWSMLTEEEKKKLRGN